MRCLTKVEETEWLKQQCLPLEPYGRDHGTMDYLQFYPPKFFRQIESFFHELILMKDAPCRCMVTVTDTELYRDYELSLIKKLRSGFGETRGLWDAPAHLFEAHEWHDVIGLFSLTVVLGWEAYLYIPDKKTVILNWEGDIFDFWTMNPNGKSELADMLKRFKLEEVKREKS